jgi:hypothetical protein
VNDRPRQLPQNNRGRDSYRKGLDCRLFHQTDSADRFQDGTNRFFNPSRPHHQKRPPTISVFALQHDECIDGDRLVTADLQRIDIDFLDLIVLEADLSDRD